MLRDKKPKPSRELRKPLGMFGVGNAIGSISSLVGAGGGFISVPFMVSSNVKIHNAVATSACARFPIAAAGTVGYIIAGSSERRCRPGRWARLPAGLFAVAGGSVLTAPLGARVAHALDTGRSSASSRCSLRPGRVHALPGDPGRVGTAGGRDPRLPNASGG